MYKKIINYIIITCFIFSLIGNCFQEHRVGIYRQQFEYYRAKLEAATNREQQLTATVDECFNNVARTGEVLSQSVSTIGELRKQIQTVRENYQIMEDRLLQFYDNYSNSNNNIDSKEIK